MVAVGVKNSTNACSNMRCTNPHVGAAWGNRTPDLFITSESLYRLS